MNMIRYGIIGCGSMGREHIENLNAMGGVQVTALADPQAASRDAAQALCHGPVQVFAHHDELLASGLCDAVVIATPNFTHIDMMRSALAVKDLHILVEKPLVTRLEDGVELMQRAQGRSGIVWVAQEYRYMPPVAEMIRIAHDGGVGRIQQVAIREHREPFYPKVGDWNRFSINTGGTLVEKCCHYFNLMDLILKEKPQRVFASGGQRVNHLDESYGGRRPDILDSAYVVVEYASGARAMLDLCMFAENTVDNEHITVVGDEGKLESLLPSQVLRHGGARTGAAARPGASPRAPAAACRCARCATPTSSTWATTSAPVMSSTSVLRLPSATARRPRSDSKRACAPWPPGWPRTAASTKAVSSRSPTCCRPAGERDVRHLPQPARPHGLHLRRQLGHRGRAGAGLCRARIDGRLLRHQTRRRPGADRRSRGRGSSAPLVRRLRRARHSRLPGPAAARDRRAGAPSACWSTTPAATIAMRWKT